MLFIINQRSTFRVGHNTSHSMRRFVARCVEVFDVGSGWFDYTEPSRIIFVPPNLLASRTIHLNEYEGLDFLDQSGTRTISNLEWRGSVLGDGLGAAGCCVIH